MEASKCVTVVEQLYPQTNVEIRRINSNLNSNRSRTEEECYYTYETKILYVPFVHYNQGNNFDDQSSQLAHITDNFDDPFILFEKWINEAESKDDLGWLNVMNLATVNKEFGVLNRSVILLKFDQTGFVFVTERNSRKFTDMMENPKVAATLYWKYKLNDNIVLKQIRINGSVSEVSAEQIRQFYAEEELPGRIRCKICVCGKPCDWHELKKQHDEVLENVRNGTEKLEQNENYTALKIQPKSIDFYFSMPGSIADRILYTKDESGGWSHQHVCA